MPVGYGSQIQLPNLTLEELSTTALESSRPNLGWLSVLLNVIEVGLSLFLGPEVGTAIALINAGAQTGINYAETGEVDALGAGINFGSALVPGLTSFAKGFKTTTLTGDALSALGETDTGGGIESLIDAAHASEYEYGGGLSDFIKQGSESGNLKFGLSHDVVTEVPVFNPQTGADIPGQFRDVYQHSLSSVTGRGRDLKKFIREFKTWNQGLIPTAADEGHWGSMVFKDGKFTQLKGKEFVDYISRRQASLQNSLSKLKFSGGISGIGETGTDIGADTENKIFRTIKSETGLFFTEITALRKLTAGGKILDLAEYRAILTKAFARTGNELLEVAILGSKQAKFLKLINATETSAMKMSRYASKTMAWGTKIGGYITSPASLAADAISKTVGKLTSEVEKIGEAIAEKLGKWIKAGKKGLDALEDEFERTGGNLIKSEWIMGYKVLAEDEIMSTILIQFKNQHPNVLTKLTAAKLVEWLESESKGSWYINNIARSRGGRTVSSLGIEGKLENLLGMLPIAKINEIVGFAGFSENFIKQIRANSGPLIWHTGEYMEGFKAGIIQGVIAEGIKGAVGIGVRNQYAKQVLEGGFGSVASGTSFGTAFSTSFAGGAQSMKDTIFEDTTKSGSVVKNVKVIQGTGSSIKGVF